jgi:hypothetical protein
VGVVQLNLFLRLHKWAARQDENFRTESLALVIQLLLEREPKTAVRLLEFITGGFLSVQPEEADTLEVLTQFETTEGIPDLVIRRSGDSLVLIEVKEESVVRAGQLEAYRSFLQQCKFERTCLILLTRYQARLPEKGARPDWAIRWFQVAEWIDQEHRQSRIQDQVSMFFCEQLVGFLGARRMSIEQVNWQLLGGVKALRAFGDMLYEIAAASGCHAQLWGDKNYLGVRLEKGTYWLGFYYFQPKYLVFSTDNKHTVDKDEAARQGIDGVYRLEHMSGHGWRRQTNLESEDVHFFSRSKESQMQFLIRFLQESLETVRRIEFHSGETPPVAAEQRDPPPAGSPLSK